MNDAHDLHVEQEWISSEEESYALECIAKFRPNKVDPSGRSAVYRFGTMRDYNSHFVSRDFPDFLEKCIHRLDTRHAPRVTCVTINVYKPKSFIVPHRDSPSSGELITVLSLGSPATMRFSDGKTLEMLPRSLFEMKGHARWNLEHEILPVQDFRVSIVFRRTGP